MHKMQLPFSNKLLGSTVASEEKQEKRLQQLRRLQELKRTASGGEAAAGPGEAGQVAVCAGNQGKVSAWYLGRRAGCPQSFIRRSHIMVKKL